VNGTFNGPLPRSRPITTANATIRGSATSESIPRHRGMPTVPFAGTSVSVDFSVTTTEPPHNSGLVLGHYGRLVSAVFVEADTESMKRRQRDERRRLRPWRCCLTMCANATT
jgi:hypothetical protein